MKETVPVYLTTMTMVENEKGEYLFLNRKKSWPGYTFPGGHIEKNESVLKCAERELFEETGLNVTSSFLKGLVHWENVVNGERYLVFCIKAKTEGEIHKGTDEGEISFRKLSDIKKEEYSYGFEVHLKVFTDPYVSEAYGTYGDGKDSEMTFYGGVR